MHLLKGLSLLLLLICCKTEGFPQVEISNLINSGTFNAACPLVDETAHPVYYANSQNCEQFYRCHKGGLTMYNCPDLLTWHQESNSCIPADKNSCSQMKNQAYTTAETTIPSTQLESAIKTTTKSPITISTLSTVSANTIDNQNLDALCANEGAAYLPYPGDCTKFIQCNGLAFVQTCPTNLHWNAALQTCDRFCKN